jgi:predicted dehydrogenase
MKVLVAGYGLMGKQRVRALQELDEIAEIAIVDPRLTNTGHLGRAAAAISFEDALSRKFDALIVSTPHDTAVDILPSLLGVAPVALIEKPLGRTRAEGERLAQQATAKGVRLFVGFNYRFLKNVRRFKELLETGELGRLLGVDAVLAHGAEPGYESESWKTDPKRCGGGVCIDPGVHLFDLIGWLFGKPELVAKSLRTSYWPIEVEDHASLSLLLPGGAPGNIFLSISSWQSRFELTAEFEHMQIMLRGRGRFYGPQRIVQIRKWPWLHPNDPREAAWDYGTADQSVRDETACLVAVARDPGKETSLATASEGLASMTIVDACYNGKDDESGRGQI